MQGIRDAVFTCAFCLFRPPYNTCIYSNPNIVYHMLLLLLRTFTSALRSHRALALENLALRQQLEVLQRNSKRPRLTNRDRTLWSILSHFWAN